MQLRRSCRLLGVPNTDTLRVEWEGQPRSVRLMDVDPESAAPGGAKAPTDFGRRTLRWMREVVLKEVGEVVLDFAGEEIMLSNSGKLLCYAHVGGENLNVRLVREGWSPCFEKYGRPMDHREDMAHAELRARYEGRGIWGGRGGRGDYQVLKTYWRIRAGQVDDVRHAMAMGEDIMCCRHDYRDIVQRAQAGTEACVFGDLTRAFHMADGSVLIQIGSPQQPLSALFPPSAAPLAGFLEREILGFGKPNYLHFQGAMSMAGDVPQITVELLDQIATCTITTLK